MQLVSEKNDEAAAKLLIEYIDEHPTDPIGYINFANLLATTNQMKEAERFFLKAIELDEGVATAYYGLGNLYFNHELYQEAEKMFQKCLKLGLEDADVFFMLGMTYVNRKDKLLALPFLQRASELDYKPTTLFQYGLALAETNYLKEAKATFDAVLKVDEAHADALYNLGIIAVYNDEIANAVHYFEQVLQIQPEHLLAQQAKATMTK